MCRFGKFGHCKFQKDCKRLHFTETCDSLSKCNDINSCKKRHPKDCKRFETGEGCRFKECSYNHQFKSKEKDMNDLKEKVEGLEK